LNGTTSVVADLTVQWVDYGKSVGSSGERLGKREKKKRRGGKWLLPARRFREWERVTTKSRLYEEFLSEQNLR